MKKSPSITHLFLDVGGVLLTNGWDHHSRKKAATQFQLDWDETEERHRLVFDTYELGKLTIEDYLNWVIFYKKRSFSPEKFREFMFAQSKPYPEMMDLIRRLKVHFGLKTFAVSNEARELNAYRILKFKLDGIIDAFISSCYVHVRKPDKELFRLALDIAQTEVGKILYIENTPMFIQVAESFGISSILHTDFESTSAKLATFGLQVKPLKKREIQ